MGLASLHYIKKLERERERERQTTDLPIWQSKSKIFSIWRGREAEQILKKKRK